MLAWGVAFALLSTTLPMLETLADRPDYVRFTAALSWFWLYRSHRTEGRCWLRHSLAHARSVDLRIMSRARALDGATVLAISQGDYEEAEQFATEYLAFSRTIDDTWSEAAALNLLGVIARAAGDLDRAADAFSAAHALFQQQSLSDWAAIALLNLGTVAFWRGDWARAKAAGTEALTLFRRQSDDYGTAVALSDLALTAAQEGDHSGAALLFAECLETWRNVGTKEVLVDWLAKVATLATAGQQAALGVSLLAAATQVAATMSYSFEPPESARQEQALMTARSMLKADELASGQVEGRSWTLEEAVVRASDFLNWLPNAAIPRRITDKAGPYGLTPRDLDVLRLLVDGLSDRLIGEALFISQAR